MKANNRFLQSLSIIWQRPAVSIATRILIGIYGCCLLADFLAPYKYDLEKREYSYAPPTAVHILHEGKITWPFVYGYIPSFDDNHRRIFKISREQKYYIEYFTQGKILTVPDPGRLYLFGADSRGRDIFSRLLYGGRISLTIAIVGALIAFSIGLTIGAISGFVGGWVDWALMRLSDMLMLLPSFYLMLAIRSGMPPSTDALMVYVMVVLILAFIGWASLARVIRAMTLTLKERDYVLSARLLGLSNREIILRHILPHTSAYALIAISLTIPSYIIAEASLSLIGLGIQDPTPSWGNMLAESMSIVVIAQSPWILASGVLIVIMVICFNLLAESLRDAVDPLILKEKV